MATSNPVGGSKGTSILLVSKTGNGKSSLGNGLLNTTKFNVGRGMLSGTEQCMSITTTVRGRQLTVVDSPGTMDVSDEERAKNEIRRAIQYCPDGFDVFLVVVKCDSRFTAEEQRAIEVVAEMFGDVFYRHAIVVFSHGDEYDNDEEAFKRDLVTIRQKIPYLNQLLNKCGNRYILTDNGRRCDEATRDRQINALLGQVDQLVNSNGGTKYTSTELETERRKAQARAAAEAQAAERRRQQEKEQIERRVRDRLFEEMESRRRSELEDQMRMQAMSSVLQLGLVVASLLASSSSSGGYEPQPRFMLGQPRTQLQSGFRLLEIEQPSSSDEDDDD